MSKLFCISGNSGAGKTTLMRYVMGTKREIVSVTTRQIRNNEIDGVDYYFISEDEFERLDKENLLAEKTTYYGRASYGVTKAEIESKLARGNAYIIVDFNGYEQLKQIYPDSVGIFIYTNKDIARERMINRGDSLESVNSRLETYEIELGNAIHYDYTIANNNDFYKTVDFINAIIRNEKE